MRTIAEVRPEELVYLTCKFKGVSVEDFFSSRKMGGLPFARVLVSYMLLWDDWPLYKVGIFIGRTHANILYYKNLIFYDRTIEGEVYDFAIWMMRNGRTNDSDECIIVPDFSEWKREYINRGLKV